MWIFGSHQLAFAVVDTDSCPAWPCASSPTIAIAFGVRSRLPHSKHGVSECTLYYLHLRSSTLQKLQLANVPRHLEDGLGCTTKKCIACVGSVHIGGKAPKACEAFQGVQRCEPLVCVQRSWAQSESQLPGERKSEDRGLLFALWQTKPELLASVPQRSSPCLPPPASFASRMSKWPNTPKLFANLTCLECKCAWHRT